MTLDFQVFMRICLWGLLLLSPGFSAYGQAVKQTRARDVVFDLDWTLINPTTEAMAEAFPKDTFFYAGQWYRFTEGTFDRLIELHLQGLRISFFSGGSPHLHFPDRYKKDLSRFFDLQSVLLVDDIQNFIMPGQEQNLIWLGPTYNDRPDYSRADLENPKDSSYSSPNRKEWFRNQNKLHIAVDKIQAVIQLAQNHNFSLPEANRLLQNKSFAVRRSCYAATTIGAEP